MDANRAIGNGATLLMARLVDRRGGAIGPAHVREITYAIHAQDPRSASGFRLLPGTGVRMRVEQVLFPALQVDKAWTMDREGYNFRHELRAGDLWPAWRPSGCCRVEYRLVLSGGGESRVWFQLRRIRP